MNLLHHSIDRILNPLVFLRDFPFADCIIKTGNWMMQRIEPASLCNRSVCVFVQLSVARSYEDLARVRSIDLNMRDGDGWH